MIKQGVHWKVDQDLDRDVWLAVDEPLGGDVNWAVDNAVWRAGYGAVTDAVNGVSRRAGDGALDVGIDEVMAVAVVHTVWRAVKDDPAHLALQDFLCVVGGAR